MVCTTRTRITKAWESCEDIFVPKLLARGRNIDISPTNWARSSRQKGCALTGPSHGSPSFPSSTPVFLPGDIWLVVAKWFRKAAAGLLVALSLLLHGVNLT